MVYTRTSFNVRNREPGKIFLYYLTDNIEIGSKTVYSDPDADSAESAF